MKLLSAILLAFFAWTSSVAFANNNDKILESSRDFSIRCKSLKDPNSAEKRIPVTINTKYSSKDQQIEINVDKKIDDTANEPFVLNYPLDFDVFKQKFDSLLNERKSDSLFVFYGSHLDVFYWIVTITEDPNLPLAGTLTTSQYILVSSEDNQKIKSHTERIKLIKNEIDSLEYKIAVLNDIEIKLKKHTIKDVTSLKLDSIKTQKEIKLRNDSLKDLSENLSKITQGLNSNDDSIKTVAKTDFSITQKEIQQISNRLSVFNTSLNTISNNLKKSNNNNNVIKALEIDSIKAQKEIVNQLNHIEGLNIRRVSHVQYQFEKGYLERIQVFIEFNGSENIEIYENSYPIGFSSVSNYRNFTDTKLFRRSSRYETDVKDNFIFLSDVIKLYENELNLATRDYSPGDTTIKVYPSSNPITRLTKQSNFYIIDGKTFTDVTGLSEDSPNGLVQVELSRRFNLWTHRTQVRGSNNFGCVNYVNAKVNFSKIENKLKGLPLRNQLMVENNAIVSPSYATNLDYLRYENLGITIDVNAFLFDAPDFKYTLFLDAGIHYGHTPIIDSVYEISQGIATTTSQEPNHLDAHNFTFFPRFKIQLFAERRYGLSFSYQANYTWLFTNNRFKQVMSYSGKGQDLNTLSTNQYAHWSHTIEAAFYIDINPSSSTGKIFTTARFFFQQGDVNTFYPQILLGYAFNIFK